MEFITPLVMVLIALLLSEMDILEHNPKLSLFPDFGWWVKPNYHEDNVFKRVVLSFTLNGWHFCKAVVILLISSLISDLTQSGINVILSTIFYYMLCGVIVSARFTERD